MNKILYLSRGPSGSGKSFEIKKYVPKERIFSTDDFWGADYKFDPSKLYQAHKWNQDRTRIAMEQGFSPIGVDNTNLVWKEIEPYANMAKENGYEIKFVESTSPWWEEFKETGDANKLLNVLRQKNQHGVPEEALKRMIQRWTPTNKLPIQESMETFKDFMLIKESSATPFLKFYKAQEQGIEPDSAVVWDCLLILEDYYRDYIRWYDERPERMKDRIQQRIYNDFVKQWQNIKRAMSSQDIKKMIIAIDQGINQWHHDYPVVAHLGMAAGSDAEDNDEADRVEEEWGEVGEVLFKLGRMSKTSPYVEN